MDWRGRRMSGNVEDRRGLSGGHFAIGGGVIGVIYLLVKFFVTGDPTDLQNQLQQAGQPTEQAQPQEDTLVQFVSVVLAETEDIWTKILERRGIQYTDPKLVLFRGRTESGCGFASAASGPFYCPQDQKVYIDLSFYQELKNRFGAGGDFAEAYVIAHEVGHHVQDLLGVTAKMDQLQSQLGEKEFNRYSVALELQADFYAGVWAHYAEATDHIVQAGDIEEALNAANAIGDDRLQKETQGYVVPDAFTHGTSAQRVYWFKKGYETGDLNQGDTFAALNL
jgi:uncharacterized protein